MSTATLNQPMTGPIVQGSVPFSIPSPKPDSNFSLLSNDPVVRYTLEVPAVDGLVIEGNRITARFIVDDNVYFDLNLIGQSIKEKDEFKVEQVFLSYQIEEQQPRAYFVANTLMAV